MIIKRDSNDNAIVLLIKNNLSMWILNLRVRLRKKELWKYTQLTFKFNLVLNNESTSEQRTQIEDEKTKWSKKIMQAIDEMTSRISLKIKQMLEASHFDNDYLMLEKLYELLQLVEDAQFMRLSKKFYSLKMMNFKNMSEFLTHIKILMKKINVTKMSFTQDKQLIICMMMTMNSRYEKLSQIWSMMSKLTFEQIRNMLLKKKRRQQNREIFDDYRVTSKQKKKCSHCERKSHSEDQCWSLHSELIFEWFKKNQKKRKNKNDENNDVDDEASTATYSVSFWFDFSRKCMRFEKISWWSKSKNTITKWTRTCWMHYMKMWSSHDWTVWWRNVSTHE